ncbi:MAG: prephenate dehydratase [archaeon]|jgi:chorismate mutase/prephenate dehydratase
MKISFLGPEATFSNIAALNHFDEKNEFVPVKTIPDVFNSVEKGVSDFGVVPAENSTDGTIRPTFDSLLEFNTSIISEIIIPINHCLLSNSKKEAVKKILSIETVFAQCKKYLRKNFPDAELIGMPSTAQAALIASKKPGSAAIGSSLASKLFSIKILEEEINDEKNNQTRFFVIGKKMPEPKGKSKTSIVFGTKNIPGALFNVLKVFADSNINLTKIESRPSKEKNWEIVFFVDFEGSAFEGAGKKAVSEIKKLCKFVKILGSYCEKT